MSALNNLATDVNALVTTSNTTPPKFTLDNVTALANAINGGTTPTYIETSNLVTVPKADATTAPVQLAPARSTRRAFFLNNFSNESLRVYFESTVANAKFIYVSPKGSLEFGDHGIPYHGGLWAHNNGVGSVSITTYEAYI